MKPTKLFVKPARPGMNLRHPVSGALPDRGKRWIDDSFTRRRIADGGISIAEPDVAQVDDAPDEVVAPVPVAAVAPAAPAPIKAAPAPQTAGVK